MKITDVKSAIIGSNIVIRVVTDKGIDGYAEVEEGKDFIRPTIPHYRDLIVGCDPTDVEFVMRRIRRAGAFKPWGKIVSTIEMALGDIAGKDAGIPVYKLLGGRVRNRIRLYNGSFRNPNPPHPVADTPEKQGENILARRELIENRAVNAIGPDPADVGGIAELKWIAEYADLHGILMAPHGTIDGVFGMAALTHVCATMPQNFIAYEYPAGRPEWWYDIVDGLPDPLLRDGHVTVWDRPGLGVEFNVNKASAYLREEDGDFFK